MRELREERGLGRSREGYESGSSGRGPCLVVSLWDEGSSGTVGVNKDVMYRILNTPVVCGVGRQGRENAAVKVSRNRLVETTLLEESQDSKKQNAIAESNCSCGKATCSGGGTPC